MVGLIAISVFALTSVGVWLILQRRLLRVTFGLALLGHAVNLLLLSAGRAGTAPPLVVPGVTAAEVADPVPQAFVLTAIVISMALTIYLLGGLASRASRGEGDGFDAPPESDGESTPDAVRAELEGEGR